MKNSIRFSYSEKEVNAVVKFTNEEGNESSYQSTVKRKIGEKKENSRFRAFVKLISNARNRNVIDRKTRISIANNFYSRVNLPNGMKQRKNNSATSILKGKVVEAA